MAIPYETIPANELVPFTYFEIAPSPSPYSANLRVVLIGNMRASGQGTAGTPYLLAGDTAARLFGAGSMLEAMYRVAKDNAPDGVEFWGVGLAVSGGDVAATTSITITNDIVTGGYLQVWIAGYKISVPINAGDTKTVVASRLIAKINGMKQLPCTAAVDGTTAWKVNLTCKWKGISGNGMRVEYGRFGGDNILAQTYLTLDISRVFSLGSGLPGTVAALGAISNMNADVIVIGPQAVSGVLDALDNFMNPTSGRWSPSQQRYGHAVVCLDDTVSNLVTLGASRNGPHVSIIGKTNAPTPHWEWAAAFGAQIGFHMAAPPECSRPLQSLQVLGVEPSRNADDWYDHDERAALLAAGVSAWTVDADRSVRINRVVTTYQTNVYGDPDPSWRDVETLFQNMYFTRYLRAAVRGAFPRCALTDEPSGIPGFVSVQQLRDFIVHQYVDLEKQGLVEKSKLFAQVLVVERDAVDRNRVNALIPIDVVNQFRIFAARIESNLDLSDSPLLAI